MLALFAAGCNNSSDTPYIPGVQTYTVTVTNGTATPTKAAAGATITVKANAPESGKVFGKWTSSTTGVTFASETSVETTFKMPASNVTVAATYRPAPSTLDLSTVSVDTEIADNTTLSGTLGASVKLTIAAGASVTLNNVSINADGSLASADHAGLVCAGDATIVLADGSTNDVKGFMDGPSGIHVLPGFTLTINGSTGVLNASSIGGGAGIGGGFGSGRNVGNIVINGGVINATGGGQYGAGIGAGGRSVVGDITINGGTITAKAGENGAGIGCGQTTSKGTSKCGNIVIAKTVTKVTATKGVDSTHCIGKGQEKDGKSAVCGTVTIGGTVGYISESPYTYQP